MSGRAGMGWLMCWRLFPAISFSSGCPKRGYADLPAAKVGDFITGCALFGVIVGGRLGYVFFYKPEMLARAVVDPAGLGRRNVEPRRDDRACCSSRFTTRVGTKFRG